jgi:hypothetical protein
MPFKPDFQWVACSLFVKQLVEDRELIWSLSPSVTFGNPRNTSNPPIVKLDIWMDRDFIYDKELGWNW